MAPSAKLSQRSPDKRSRRPSPPPQSKSSPPETLTTTPIQTVQITSSDPMLIQRPHFLASAKPNLTLNPTPTTLAATPNNGNLSSDDSNPDLSLTPIISPDLFNLISSISLNATLNFLNFQNSFSSSPYQQPNNANPNSSSINTQPLSIPTNPPSNFVFNPLFPTQPNYPPPLSSPTDPHPNNLLTLPPIHYPTTTHIFKCTSDFPTKPTASITAITSPPHAPIHPSSPRTTTSTLSPSTKPHEVPLKANRKCHLTFPDNPSVITRRKKQRQNSSQTMDIPAAETALQSRRSQ